MSMKLHTHIKLTADLIKKITALFPVITYKVNSTLFYEGQIPISGYLLIDGTIQITNKKKMKQILNPGTLLGVQELMLKKPSNISAEVFPNTEICYLDKTTLNNLCNEDDSDLAQFLIEHLKDVV